MKYHDADSHFMEPFDWLEGVDPALADEVPVFKSKLDFRESVIGEILALVPETERPPASDILPPAIVEAVDRVFAESAGLSSAQIQERIELEPALASFANQKGSYEPVDRIAVNDGIGVSLQIVNPTYALALVERARLLAGGNAARRMCRAYNTWATNTLDGYLDRLVPTAMVEIDDIDWTVEELKRVSARGSRAFLPPMNPVAGRSLGDPYYDPMWVTALEHRMLPVLHLGRGEVQLSPDWGKVGGALNLKTFARMAIAQRSLVAQLSLSSIVYGGVFDRFPELVVLCEEFGLAWIQNWLDHLGTESRDGAKTFGGMFGWEHVRTPLEILGTNLRFTPLPGQRVDQIIDMFGSDLVMFCTDYPHPEGTERAADYFHSLLDGRYDDEVADKFFWKNLEDLLAPQSLSASVA